MQSYEFEGIFPLSIWLFELLNGCGLTLLYLHSWCFHMDYLLMRISCCMSTVIMDFIMSFNFNQNSIELLVLGNYSVY